MTDHGHPACDGQSDLFLSIDTRDHERAAEICATCPALVWCMKETGEALRSVHGLGVHGTWAGVLYNKGRRSTGKASVGDCPQCGATDGHTCRSPEGISIGSPHRARTYGLPSCGTCGNEFTRTRQRIRYCSDPCAAASHAAAKARSAAKERVRVRVRPKDNNCVGCGAMTGGTWCNRCAAARASRISFGREVSA